MSRFPFQKQNRSTCFKKDNNSSETQRKTHYSDACIFDLGFHSVIVLTQSATFLSSFVQTKQMSDSFDTVTGSFVSLSLDTLFFTSWTVTKASFFRSLDHC